MRKYIYREQKPCSQKVCLQMKTEMVKCTIKYATDVYVAQQ